METLHPRTGQILETYGLPTQNPYPKRVSALLTSQDKFNLPFNPALFTIDFEEHFHRKLFPTAPKALGYLFLTWQREVTTDETKLVAPQAASLRRDLTDDFGYIFRGEGKHKYLFYNAEGKQCRQVIGFAPPKLSRGLINPLAQKLFLAGKICPFTGVKATEVDHRTPFTANQKRGQATPPLTKGLLADGLADVEFQCVSKAGNMIKKAACGVCIAGKPIPIPLVVTQFGHPFKTNWDNQSCVGCYFHTPLVLP